MLSLLVIPNCGGLSLLIKMFSTPASRSMSSKVGGVVLLVLVLVALVVLH